MNGQDFAQTNHLINQELSAQVEYISHATKENSHYRMELALELLKKEKAASADSIAKILSTQENEEGYLSAYHDILKAHTIQTAIFTSNPRGQDLYLSAEDAPAASGKYVKVSLMDLWGKIASIPYELVDLTKTPEEKRVHQREISHAFHLFFDEHKFLEAAAVLESHPTLDAALFRSAALFRAGEYEQSLLLAQNTRANLRFMGAPTYILQSLDWVQFSDLWRLQRFEEAKNLAQRICEAHPINPRLKKLCDTVSAGSTPPSSLVNVSFEFFTGDLSGRAD
jgi:hypothetical protein